MPWDIKRNESRCPASRPFGVVKRDDGDLEGCHETRAAAKRQMAALYSAESKEAGMEDTQPVTAPVTNGDAAKAFQGLDPWIDTRELNEEKAHYIAYAPFAKSFAELDAAQEAAEMAEDIHARTAQFAYLSENIMANPEVDDKAAALAALAQEFASIVQAETKEKEAAAAEPDPPSSWQQFKDGVMTFLSGALGKSQQTEPEPKRGGFTVYKDTETGAWRWLAVYSNKYRDEDHPPEILADAAHRDFARAVETKEWPYPELWLWHVEGTRCGVCDLVTYDDRGFAVASGYFDEGKEATAEALAEDDDLLVSHGMPSAEIERGNGEDETIITRYRTREISVLPATAAANKLTGFAVTVQEESDMGLPQDKREFLADKMGEEAVAALEEQIGEKATMADELGLDHKETAQEMEAGQEPEPDAEKEGDEEAVPEPTPLTVNDIASTIVETITAAMAPVTARLDALEAGAKEKAEEEQSEVEQLVSMTPAASLKELVIQSVIGRPETRVDGRTALGKDKPPETPDSRDGTGISIFSAIRSGGDWRAELGDVQPVEQ